MDDVVALPLPLHAGGARSRHGGGNTAAGAAGERGGAYWTVDTWKTLVGADATIGVGSEARRREARWICDGGDMEWRRRREEVSLMTSHG